MAQFARGAHRSLFIPLCRIYFVVVKADLHTEVCFKTGVVCQEHRFSPNGWRR
jgi:hypothetical protein